MKKGSFPDKIMSRFLKNGHGRPTTRREFLAQGLGMSSMIFLAPTIQSLLARKLYAATLSCPLPALASGRVPFLCFDLAGGANIPGSNVIVGSQGGQKDFLSSYSSLGLPDGMKPQDGTGQVNEEFGLAFHSDSAFLRGLQSTTSSSTRLNIDGALFCAASSDDTANNTLNPSYWIAASGPSGGLGGLAGTQNSTSGGNSKAPPASVNPAFLPVTLGSPADAVALVQLGRISTLISPDKAIKIAKAISNLSSSQLALFNSSVLTDQVKQLVSCGYLNASLLSTVFQSASVDPLQDANVNAVFTNINQDGEEQKTGTMAKLVLEGYFASATIVRGGNDYHTGNRSTGEGVDFQTGKLIGQSLELAAKKGKDLMVYVCTDGGVFSDGTLDSSAGGRGKGVWTGDFGLHSGAFILVYRNSGPRSAKAFSRKAGRQIGWYSESSGKVGVNLGANLASNDPSTLAKAIVANYLALHGDEGKLASIVGTNPFGADLESYLAFQSIL